MKKFISIMLAAAIALSLTACTGSESSAPAGNSSQTSEQNSSQADASGSADSTPESSAAESTAAESTADEQPDAEPEKELLSNPIALTADGDIDMDVALAYQTDVDAVKASFEAKEVDPTQPVSENARNNEKTMEVWNYLRSIYGKQIMTCQEMMSDKCYEDLVYYNATGDLPAMKGYDFIFSTGSYTTDYMIDEAIKWSKESGGLVNFTWHWNVPTDISDPNCNTYAFYTSEITNFDQINAVTPGTKEYEVVIHDIDLIATKLQRLESEGVTVLFRPLHEASGSWFWWGMMGKSTVENEVFQKLWYMIYDRLENYHKLTNIIWVWNGQSSRLAVHPNSYDIAGIDRYYDSGEPTRESLAAYNTRIYGELVNYDEQCAALAGLETTGKMLALTECGYTPDPQNCADTNTMWLFYMIWYGDFVYETDAAGNARVNLSGTPYPNTARMTNEMLQEYFGSDLFVTHGKLPEFSFGKHDIPEKVKTWEYFKLD